MGGAVPTGAAGENYENLKKLDRKWNYRLSGDFFEHAIS